MIWKSLLLKRTRLNSYQVNWFYQMNENSNALREG